MQDPWENHASVRREVRLESEPLAVLQDRTAAFIIPKLMLGLQVPMSHWVASIYKYLEIRRMSWDSEEG